MEDMTTPDSGKHHRQGNSYQISKEEILQFKEQGYVVLNDVLTEAEISTLDPWFEHFIANKEPELRRHKPKNYGNLKDGEINRADSHTLVIESKPGDEVIYLPVKRGSVTIHDEKIVHGSGGNNTADWRKTYVMAFRDEKTIEEERAMGFTHSHNDQVNWKEII